MRPLRFLFIALLCTVGVASAGAIEYQVIVDTSTMSGIVGSLEFQFNPGPLVTQGASLQILSFTSDGALGGSPGLVGDVGGGPLPSALNFDNGSGFNDYFEGFTFGSSLKFYLMLYGPALSAPDGTSTSGSTFAFSMFSDAEGTVPLLTADFANGFAVTVDVNLDGTTTATNSSLETTISPVSAVPEPSCLLPVAAFLALAGLGLRKHRYGQIRSQNCPG